MDYRSKYSELFLGIENDLGAGELNLMMLDALQAAIHEFHERDEKDFFGQFYGLLQNVKNTSPRFGILIDSLYEVWLSLQDAQMKDYPSGHLCWEHQVMDTIKEIKTRSQQEQKKIIKTGISQVLKNDVILIHGISRTVLHILTEAKKAGKDFRVVVTEQETEKTQQLIENLTRHGIHFQVVPEYMLSHIENEVTKVFMGAVSINNQFNVVAAAGSNAVVSEFHLHKTPIYLFLSTRKFSLWKSRDSHHTYKVKSTRSYGPSKPMTFERITFSHDRIPLEFYDYIITETGKLNPSQLQKLYQQKYEERSDWRKEFFKED